MRVLFDIAHPAHVHFFRYMIRSLESRGHAVRLVARRKDVTLQLLDRLGFAYEAAGQAGHRGWLGQAKELIERDFALLRVAREFGPDVIVTRNPTGAQVGRLMGIRAVFDTDDGKAAGVHFWAAAPLAHVVTTPDCIGERYGRRHVTYPGYKQTAYLHPNHFTPDPGVLADLGVSPGERYFLVRFVAMGASHDAGERGLPIAVKREIIARLRARGRVFVTSEVELPADLASLQFPAPPDRLHDALAFCDLLVGDSQTMAAEAAVLGTPNLRVSSWAGRLAYLEQIEQRYGLTYAYRPSQIDALYAKLDRWIAEENLRASLAVQHRQLLSEKVDVARWFVDYLEAGAPLGGGRQPAV
jgi:hypothetical protein